MCVESDSLIRLPFVENVTKVSQRGGESVVGVYIMYIKDGLSILS